MSLLKKIAEMVGVSGTTFTKLDKPRIIRMTVLASHSHTVIRDGIG